MAGVNKVIILGRLGRDPELRTTKGGSPVCNLSVATDRTWINNQTQEKQQETEWHRIVVWGKQAENCEKYLSKGREVFIEGRLRTSDYEKDGVKHWTTEIVADTVQFIGGRDSGNGGGGGGGGGGGSRDGGGGNSGGGNSGGGGGDEDDDIPF